MASYFKPVHPDSKDYHERCTHCDQPFHEHTNGKCPDTQSHHHG